MNVSGCPSATRAELHNLGTLTAEIESSTLRVINIAASGPIVMTERADIFKLPNKSFELQVMGIFEVSGGKVSAWRDYFDMNQFTSRMG